MGEGEWGQNGGLSDLLLHLSPYAFEHLLQGSHAETIVAQMQFTQVGRLVQVFNPFLSNADAPPHRSS